MTATLAAFALAATLLILAPGPDSMLVLRNTLRRGRRAGWVTACGTLTGLLTWATAAAFGLSALLRASVLGYDILRVAGAGYLFWLGVTSLARFRRARPAPEAVNPAPEAVKLAPEAANEVNALVEGRLYLNGLVCNLLNPKIGVFFIAFLPGFIPARTSTAAFSLLLGLWFIAETGAWLAALSWMVARGAGWLRGSAVQRWAERVTGVVLIGFGLRLAAEAR
jgi:threonine/homoserine/homoserine lactone efflux protein